MGILTVFLVDNYLLTRISDKRQFEYYSEYKITGDFRRAKDCLEALGKQTADIVITDVELPDINGIETCKIIKEKYPKATHYCYAYIYNDIKKSSDDGEPSNTAGSPMLNVLEKENLNNILAVTVRYFGGIKLGAGGLIRAYTKSLTESLKEAEFINLIKGYKIKLIFDYNNEKQINYILGNSKIIEKEYDEKITYITLIEEDKLSNLENYNYQVLESLYIEKDL